MGQAVFVNQGLLGDQQGIRVRVGDNVDRDKHPGSEFALRVFQSHGHLERTAGRVHRRGNPLDPAREFPAGQVIGSQVSRLTALKPADLPLRHLDHGNFIHHLDYPEQRFVRGHPLAQFHQAAGDHPGDRRGDPGPLQFQL